MICWLSINMPISQVSIKGTIEAKPVNHQKPTPAEALSFVWTVPLVYINTWPCLPRSALSWLRPRPTSLLIGYSVDRTCSSFRDYFNTTHLDCWRWLAVINLHRGSMLSSRPSRRRSWPTSKRNLAKWEVTMRRLITIGFVPRLLPLFQAVLLLSSALGEALVWNIVGYSHKIASHLK